jgi:myo-inositol-1(or 4)-monophosphatase
MPRFYFQLLAILSPMAPQSDELQSIVSRAGAEELLPRFHQVGHRVKNDGSILTEADIAMQRRLCAELAQRWPEIDFMSEEMPPERQQALLRDAERPLWCLDPLDGTSNFAAGLPCFAVSLALLVGGKPVMGVIYDPMHNECFRADKNQGAWLNEQRLMARATRDSLDLTVALVDLKRLATPLARKLAEYPPYASQRNFGSSALEWAWVAAGRGHVYLHGGQKLWDFAAGSLILDEAGGYSSTLECEPVFKRTLSSRSVVAASNDALFQCWRQWLTDVEN